VDIPALELNSAVIAVGWRVADTNEGDTQVEWDSPGRLAGWAITSGLPGDGSNIILYGHNNLYTSVFRDLGDLKTGDRVSLTTGEREWEYSVSRVLFLQTTFAEEATVKSYEEYMQPGVKEQLTLISCWPPISNTHRVIVLARPEK
jgi:sortase A